MPTHDGAAHRVFHEQFVQSLGSEPNTPSPTTYTRGICCCCCPKTIHSSYLLAVFSYSCVGAYHRFGPAVLVLVAGVLLSTHFFIFDFERFDSIEIRGSVTPYQTDELDSSRD